MIASVPSSPAVAWPAVGLALEGEAGVALNAPERERCAGLPTEEARRDFRAGRLAARRAVEALRETGWGGGVSAETGRAGVPVGPPWIRGASVSLSHRDGHGLAAAVGAGGLVGVDLDREGEVAPDQARYFLSARERRAFVGEDPTVAWTLKEAVWKLLRLGREVGFHAVRVTPEDAGAPGVADVPEGVGPAPETGPAAGLLHVRVEGRELGARYVIVRPWPGWVGAVVWTEGTRS